MDTEAYHLIEKYLNDDLNAEERQAFEKRLAEDTDFADAFEAYRSVEKGLHAREHRQAGESALRDNLESISKDYFGVGKEEKQGKVIALKQLYWVAAASIVLVLGIVFFFNRQSPSNLYAEYANYQPLMLAERGDQDSLKLIAETAFNSGKYEKAADALLQLADDNSDNAELKLYLGIALIENGQYEKAEEILTVIQKGNSIYKEKAAWHLALSYLKQDEIEKCRNILMGIPSSAEEYDLAQQLLGEL